MCFVCNNYMEVYTKCIISIVTTNVYSITFHPHVCCLTVHNHSSQEQTGAAFYTVCVALQIPCKAQKQSHRSAEPAGFSLLPLKCTVKSPLMAVTQCWRNKTAIRERQDLGQDSSVQPSHTTSHYSCNYGSLLKAQSQCCILFLSYLPLHLIMCHSNWSSALRSGDSLDYFFPSSPAFTWLENNNFNTSLVPHWWF